MDTDTVIGVAVATAAMAAIVGLMLWSRAIVERIRRRRLTSYRQIRGGPPP